MKSPIILEGPDFCWKAGEEAGKRVVDEDGVVNWGAAMLADPGVMSCPECKVHLWAVGWKVRCPECGHEFITRNGLARGKKYTADDTKKESELLAAELRELADSIEAGSWTEVHVDRNVGWETSIPDPHTGARERRLRKETWKIVLDKGPKGGFS